MRLLHSLALITCLVLGASVSRIQAQSTGEPFRLDRIAVTQFTDLGSGTLGLRNGVMRLGGSVLWRPMITVDRPTNTPEWALNRNLIRTDHWNAYYALGAFALEGFEVLEGSVKIFVGDVPYYAVGTREDADLPPGRLSNLSTLVSLSGPGQTVTAGFVIENHARSVLIRAVGPGLSQFGVTNPLPDPFISIQKRGQTIAFNNDWWNQLGRTEVESAAGRVGAFPLTAGSSDSARVVSLAPGAYTVLVENTVPGHAGGTVLIEIYDLPSDFNVE